MNVYRKPSALKRALDQLGRESKLFLKENRNVRKQLKEQRELIEMIPLGFPDGTGFFSPKSMLKWILKKAGYTKCKAKK